MKTKKVTIATILIFTIVILSCISLTEARLGEFPRGSCVNIKTILNASSVNISTINYVNTSTAVSNQAMTKNGKSFNYTFCDTNELGVYTYDYFDDNGEVYVNDFLISNIGNTITTGAAIVYIIVLISVSLLFAFFFWITWITPYDNIGEIKGKMLEITKVTKSKYIKIIAAWITYGMFLWIISIVTGLANNYIWFGGVKTLSTNLYMYLSVLGKGINMFVIVLLIINIWKDILLNKTILRDGKAFIEGKF